MNQPSLDAMKAAVELEIENAIGRVTTRSIGALIDKVADVRVAAALSSYDEVGASLREVREWISNWSPNFEQDEEWPAVRKRMDAAIAKAEGH